MKKSKIVIALTGATIAGVLLTGCGKDKSKDTTQASINVEPISTMTDADNLDVAEVVTQEGMVINELTGEWIDETLENQRPLCVMINNVSEAMPQSGISQADVTYEMLVEGGITRLLCVFKDYDEITKLGPIRSARHYYVEVADMLDGLYAHVGWSPLAEEEIPKLGVDNLNGLLALSTIMYYRDDTRYAPHNCYTDGPKTIEGINYEGYSTEYTSDPEKMFSFNYNDTNLGTGLVANKVTTAFSSYQTPWFEYNSEDGLYYRFQYGSEQIDDQNGEQLKYKNIVVMFVAYSTLDDVGHRDVDWNKGGSGYYITNGEYSYITWKKENGVLKYFDENGNQLKMNPGKSFISVFDETNQSGITFE